MEYMKVALNSRLDEGKMYSQVQDEDLDESVNRKGLYTGFFAVTGVCVKPSIPILAKIFPHLGIIPYDRVSPNIIELLSPQSLSKSLCLFRDAKSASKPCLPVYIWD